MNWRSLSHPSVMVIVASGMPKVRTALIGPAPTDVRVFQRWLAVFLEPAGALHRPQRTSQQPDLMSRGAGSSLGRRVQPP